LAFQMYMVAFDGEFSDAASRSVQHCIRDCKGFTLMVMKTGVIAAFDDAMVPRLQAHPAVRLVGGVTLNPRGFAAERVQRIFAENLSKQIEVRPEPAPPPQVKFSNSEVSGAQCRS
jgi:hypothetical protein